MSAEHDNHGMSVANWTGVGVIILGSVIMSLAVIQDARPLFIVGAVVVVAGIVAGKVLSMAGYGVDGAKKRCAAPPSSARPRAG